MEEQTAAAQETFGNFDLTRALEYLQLYPYDTWAIAFQAIPPSDALMINLRRAERHITTGSNEWDQRLLMELIFLEALDQRQIRMWQEKQLDAGMSPLKGKVDFAFTPNQARFQTPYIVVAEAKKEDFDQGWGQCLLAMKAASVLNRKAEIVQDLYGIVSNGRTWEFGQYTRHNTFARSEAYSLGQPDAILGILDVIFRACEQYLAK